MARVLDAERRAREAVKQCEAEAARLRDAARTQEKLIAERAARRIAAIRAGMASKLATRLANIESATRTVGQDTAPDNTSRTQLVIAVDRLADELAGTR